jgi:hypothetical protein
VTRKRELIKEVEAKLAGKPLDLSALGLTTLLMVRDDIVLGLSRK